MSAPACRPCRPPRSYYELPQRLARLTVRSVRRLRVEADRLDDEIVDRAVLGAGRRALEAVDNVHAVRDLAEDSVLAVEPRARVGGDDEELRAVGVGPAVGHRQGAAHDL